MIQNSRDISENSMRRGLARKQQFEVRSSFE